MINKSLHNFVCKHRITSQQSANFTVQERKKQHWPMPGIPCYSWDPRLLWCSRSTYIITDIMYSYSIMQHFPLMTSGGCEPSCQEHWNVHANYHEPSYEGNLRKKEKKKIFTIRYGEKTCNKLGFMKVVYYVYEKYCGQTLNYYTLRKEDKKKQCKISEMPRRTLHDHGCPPTTK